MLNHHVEKKRRYIRFNFLSSDTSIPYGIYTTYVDISFSFLNKDLSRKCAAVAVQEGKTDPSMSRMAIHLPLLLLTIHDFCTSQHNWTDGIESLHLKNSGYIVQCSMCNAGRGNSIHKFWIE